MNIRQRIRNTFSRFAFLNQEPWRSLWIKRFMEYFIIFLIICIPVYLLLLDFNALPTQKENALLILTSIVQLQGAIIAIVITLTLIAIQMGASTYSPRVVDVMEKNPDMWYLLFFYLISISYGFFLLKQINDNDLYLVSSVYILGIFAIFALVPYMLNTNHLLRADTIVSMLVQEIDTRNISGEEDTLQPVFDMIYASIMRSDITTTRNGLMSLSDRIIFLLKRLEIEVIERTISIIYKYLKRLALIVIKNGDEEIFEEIIFTLQKFCLAFSTEEFLDLFKKSIQLLKLIGIYTADLKLDEPTQRVIETLERIGISIENQNITRGTHEVVNCLEGIGIHTSDKDLDKATRKVIEAFEELGFHFAEKDLDFETLNLVQSLEQVGIHVINSNMDSEKLVVIRALERIGILAIERNLFTSAYGVSIALGTIGTQAADKGQNVPIKEITKALETIAKLNADKEAPLAADKIGNDYPIWITAQSFEKIGIHAADKGLKDEVSVITNSLESVGMYVSNTRLGRSTLMIVGSLGQIGLHIIKMGLDKETERIIESLNIIGNDAAEKGLTNSIRKVVESLRELGNATDENLNQVRESIIMSLFSFGLKRVSQKFAANALSDLMLQFRDQVEKCKKEFQTHLSPASQSDFDELMKLIQKKVPEQ